MDKYLLYYITSFLTNCKNCNKYSIKTPYICVICNDAYCETCSNKLYKVYGFYCQHYCKECYESVI